MVTCVIPLRTKLSFSAAIRARSMERFDDFGRRSFTRTYATLLFFMHVTLSQVPKGRDLWAQVYLF